ncbi:portal vertex protein of head [Rhizobium phage RHph_TM30]|uniref:Portal vertex protein of head n=1 Tax=Rhizobium phage RHph_TM30 TaxID=2509764 RepID=A0A7S5UW75_9CAUD|nr:portal vertex protein of head [Rhizobium phage RHph_TM30]QIG71469.1 portal vertex protein of head [Rhizobium phage RHph_TM30]QIG72194.1 portal vertex protein of head [Rhizobium phage RHph_TM2_3B]
MAGLFERLYGSIFEAKTTPAPVAKKSTGATPKASPVVASAMASVFTSAVNSRDDYLKEFNQVKGYYLVDALLTNISEDALTPDISSGEILKVTSPNEKYNRELEKFQKMFDLDNIVNDITPDLLSYGEYPLRMTIQPGKGVTEITDDLNPSAILGFYRQGYPFKFLVKTKNRSNQDSYELKDPHEIAHFILSGRKIRVPTFSEHEKQELSKIEGLSQLPSHARIGKPILFGVLSKIKELQLLEKLIPAVKLSDITAGSIVGVEVPASTDPKEAFNIAREYENLFNKKIAVDPQSGMLTASDILTVAGRIKVVPTFAGKGGMQNIDVRNNSNVSDVMNTIRDTRDVICTSIGFPTELFFGGASKTETIKKYARYLRKIKAIQNSIASGVLQICLTHLKNCTATRDVTLADLEVQFLNETVNVDELEKLEYHDATVGMLRNTFTFLNDIEDAGLNDIVDEDALKTFLQDKLNFLKYDGEHKGNSRNTNQPNPKTSKLEPKIVKDSDSKDDDGSAPS